MSQTDISNTSYCSKDFGSIYPEVLDLAKKITTSWDPSASNESDPGVVLLKEAAFIDDHMNYNIDKNTLENFLPTATQDKSVRNIVEMNGYIPRYYVSANGGVSFKYTIPEDSTEEAKTFVIPAFSLIISDPDEQIMYTQVKELGIVFEDGSRTSATSSCEFVQGILQSLTVNGSTTITTENLDDNNRIYLPEIMVAQNGVYVKYADDALNKDQKNAWVRDNYLLAKPAGSRVFKLDYDSDKELPYIEFPADISNLIESGLMINYISTSGVTGNVSANTLTHLVSPTTVEDRDGATRDCSFFTLTNVSAIGNGKDPETIKEMYTSFRKVVGTFETLVTREDYANRIYSLANDYDMPYVSNVIVTDRRNDINKTAGIVTADSNGVYTERVSLQNHQLTIKGVGTSLPTTGDYPKGSMYILTNAGMTTNELYVNMAGAGIRWERHDTINLNDFAILSDAMTPYDLIIYALKAFTLSDFSNDQPYKALETSFTKIDAQTLANIKDGLEDGKCINHKFIDPADNDTQPGDVYCYKNYAPLNITITPYYKVTKSVLEDIKNNIYRALSENYNPRCLEWGEKLNILDLKEVILNSDDRIRDVNITEIKYNTSVLKNNGQEVSIMNENNSVYLIDLIAKNVLAGRVCLFNFDDRFSLEFGQQDGETFDNIKTISTEVLINVEPSIAQTVSYQESQGGTVRNITIASGSGLQYFLSNQGGNNISAGNAQRLVYNADTGIGGTFKLLEGSIYTEDATTYQATVDKTYEISFSGSMTNMINDGSWHSFTGDNVLTIREIIYTKNVSAATENVNYTLHDNEAIQIVSPSYYSETTYSTYVYYRYIDLVNQRNIPSDTDYTLSEGQRIVISYTSDGVTVEKTIEAGETIRASFTIVPTDLASGTTIRDWTDSNGILVKNAAFKVLSSSQTISIRKLMLTKLSNTALRCYWKVNDSPLTNNLFTDSGEHQYERILGTNEYFVYTNDMMNEMVIVGSGTKLVRSQNDTNMWSINAQDISLQDIETKGISDYIPWQSVNLSGTPLSIQEMNVITLGKDDTIIISGWTNYSRYYISNDWQACNGNIIYKLSDGTTEVSLPAAENLYAIRSRFDLIASADTPQQLFAKSNDDPQTSEDEGDAVQTVRAITSTGETHIIRGNALTKKFLQSSVKLSLIGGNNISVDNISLYAYEIDSTPPEWSWEPIDSESWHIPTTKQTIIVDHNVEADGYMGYTSTSEDDGLIYHYKAVYKFYNSGEAPIPGEKEGNNKKVLIPIKIDGDDVTINVRVANGLGTSLSFTDFNVTSTTVTAMELLGNKLYFISPVQPAEPMTEYLELTWTTRTNLSSAEIITVGNPSVIDGTNDLISVKQYVTLDAILNRMNAIISSSDKPNTKYYYTYNVDDNAHINLDSYCHKESSTYTAKAFDNSEIMWDISNVGNDMTIAQVDIRNSTINIESGMLKE